VAKYRQDLVVAAFRIMTALAKGRVDFLPILGDDVIEIKKAFRIRLPFKTNDAQRRRGRDKNRMTIPICFLYKRWVGFYPASPLWYLTTLLKEERRRKGIFYNQEEECFEILTYEVVEDYSHLLRMHIHIWANYQRERTRNELMRREVGEVVTSAQIWGPSLSRSRRAEMEAFQNWLGDRERDIGHITGKLGARGDLAYFHAIKTALDLDSIAKSLRADIANLRRRAIFNLENFKTHLRDISERLNSVVSKEIRFFRRACQKILQAAINSVDGGDRISTILFLQVAESHLQVAILKLQNWAESITTEEMEEADRYRQVVVL